MCENINKVKEWLTKKEQPLKQRKSLTRVSGNLRTVGANVLLNHIKKNYILVKK